jgi:hypothetical protein
MLAGTLLALEANGTALPADGVPRDTTVTIAATTTAPGRPLRTAQPLRKVRGSIKVHLSLRLSPGPGWAIARQEEQKRSAGSHDRNRRLGFTCRERHVGT